MKRFIIGSLLIVILLFAVFVWPTRYKYYRLNIGRMNTVMRENRFTGRIWMLTPAGWEDYGGEASDQKTETKK